MKFLVAILVLAAVASASSLEQFRAWSKGNNKLYTAAEERRRFAIYKENLAIIERLNLDSTRATFAPNKFSDLTVEEFSEVYASGLRGKKFTPHLVGSVAINEDIDYRDMLPAVKDQASCGSCWAFSAVANMEGQTYKKNGGEVVSLSEQQLVSCDKMDSGCNGGSMVYADYYAINNGMASEAAYPYTSATGSVAACKKFTVVAEFSSQKNFGGSTLSDKDLMAHLKEYGPLSVGIAAATSYFQSYSSGILDNVKSCGKDLDHGVTLVGAGSEDGVDYWMVRNSWGQSWGEKGYVRFIRGNDMCGVNEMVSTIVA